MVGALRLTESIPAVTSFMDPDKEPDIALTLERCLNYHAQIRIIRDRYAQESEWVREKEREKIIATTDMSLSATEVHKTKVRASTTRQSDSQTKRNRKMETEKQKDGRIGR